MSIQNRLINKVRTMSKTETKINPFYLRLLDIIHKLSRIGPNYSE